MTRVDRRWGHRIALGAALLSVSTACAVLPVRAERTAHGSLTAEAKATDGVRRRWSRKGMPQVILLERSGLRAIDPESARELWYRRVPVAGHGAVAGDLVVVPARGHRLVAVDRRSGEVRWDTPLPGEVLVGLDADERFAALSVAGARRGEGRRFTGRLVLVDLQDGTIRWVRRSQRAFGAPAIRAHRVFVPLGARVLAFSVATGRELARRSLPMVAERVEVQRGTLVAGAGTRWVDLETSDLRPLAMVSGAADLLRRDGGVDPGPWDRERLRWWVRVPEDASSPREGVLLARRAVVAVRFDGRGRADRVHWIHVAPDRREYVGMDVGRRYVTLVREDGGIVRLSAADGTVLDAIAGGDPVYGALFCDVSTEEGPTWMLRPDEEKVARRARRLLADADARLLPAQRLVLSTLWRDASPEHRRIVLEVARRGGTRSTPAREALRAEALALAAQPWGDADLEARRALGRKLAEIVEGRVPPEPGEVGILVRRAAAQGDPAWVPLIARLLDDPRLAEADLAQVAWALAELDRPESVPAAAAFLLRYHADPRVVHGSGTMFHLTDHLVSQAAAGTPQGAKAQATLDEILADPFTERRLAAYIARHRPNTTLAAVTEPKDARGEQEFRPKVPGSGL